MKAQYQICVRCVMDTSDPDITFDDEGVCSHCASYQRRIEQDLHTDEAGSEHLSAVVERLKLKSRDRQYDCLIGISGGVDSTYVAYLAKEVFGLRPLAVHFDNGWNSELAVKNIEKTLNKLDIDLITYVVDWAEFRDLQKSFIEASVINWEIPTDHAITAILYKIASERKIKYILGGGNIATEAIMPMSWVFYARDWFHIRKLHSQFSSKKLVSFPSMSMFRFIYYTYVKGIKWFPVLNYVDFDKEEAMGLLQERLGWIYYGGKHYESIFTRFYQGYVLPEKFGVDKRRAHFSALINSGQLSRDDAVERLTEQRYDPELFRTDKRFFLKKFGWTDTEFTEVFNRPIRSHEEYGSRVYLFKKFAGAMAFVKKYATDNPRSSK